MKKDIRDLNKKAEVLVRFFIFVDVLICFHIYLDYFNFGFFICLTNTLIVLNNTVNFNIKVTLSESDVVSTGNRFYVVFARGDKVKFRVGDF